MYAGGIELQKVIVAGDRIVYTGAASEDMVSFKSPGLVSIAMDGSGRRVAGIPYNVYNGLSYEGGYLYYQGWTNDGALPGPLYRMAPDFGETEFLADIDGSLMTVKEGGILYVYNWKKQQVEVGAAVTVTLKPVDPSGEAETYRMYVPKGV